MRIIAYNEVDFDNNWLAFIEEDPIHPSIPLEKRIIGNRTVLVLVDEVSKPQAFLCVKLGNKLPQNIQYIMRDEPIVSLNQHTYAIFYSIFRLKNSTLKGAGAIAIKSAKSYFHNMGIKRFYTLSPIPDLTKAFAAVPDEAAIIEYLMSGKSAVSKFHMGNGAEIHAINFNADTSSLRILESWGIMVNYDYSDYL
jgi:malonyl-CoA decarboxylase